MTSVVQRAFEVASETFQKAPRDRLAHPFGFADHATYRWRVSPDVWAELVAHVGFGDPERATPDARLLGEPIEIDETLLPDSMVLEPVSAVGSAVGAEPEA